MTKIFAKFWTNTMLFNENAIKVTGRNEKEVKKVEAIIRKHGLYIEGWGGPIADARSNLRKFRAALFEIRRKGYKVRVTLDTNIKGE